MRFIHTADLHIGKIVNEFSMLKDQAYILDKISEIAVKEKVDAVIIAGDVYDRSIPPADAVCL
ncbi:MAG: metallophosphoesterase family protein, partial [Lachnospiraceae bacterium]